MQHVFKKRKKRNYKEKKKRKKEKDKAMRTFGQSNPHGWSLAAYSKVKDRFKVM